MNNSGLVFAKREGGKMHPDDMGGSDMQSDEDYLKQLRAYMKQESIKKEDVFMVRDRLYDLL